MPVKKRVTDSAVDIVAKAAKVSSVASSSLLAIAEDPLKTPGPEWPPSNAQKLQKPVLPASDADHVARHVMKEVIPWVLQELPTYLQELPEVDRSVCLTKRAPLHIQPSKEDTEDKKKMTSFKEAWVLENVIKSIQQSKMYEAGGNATWLNPEVWDENFLIPGPEPSWAWVGDCARQNFKAFEGGSTGERITFPIRLAGVWSRDVGELDTGYPVGMRPLGAHGFLYGWYLAVFLAMEANDNLRVAMLYQAALTATVMVFADCDKPTVLMHAMHFSEIVRHSTDVLVDSFVTFAQKCHAWTPKLDLDALKKAGIRFNGSNVSLTMLKAVNHVRNLSPEAHKIISVIDRKFGFEVLSGNYNKMLRLMQGTHSKVAKQDDLILWSLQSMYVLLKRGECTQNDFKVDQFIKTKDGSPSWIAQCLVQRSFMEHIHSVVDGMSAVDPTLADKLNDEVLSKFANPMMYDSTFPMQDKDCTMEDTQVPEGDESRDVGGSEYMQQLQEKLPKAGPLLAEVCKKCYDGTYDELYQHFAVEEASVLQQALQIQSADRGKFGQDLDELLKALNTAQAVVGTSGGSAPTPSLRDLVRQKSDPSGSAEDVKVQREQVWKKAVVQRQKLVKLRLVMNPKSPAAYADSFRTAGETQDWKATKKHEHRVFVLSADLISDAGDSPWVTKAAPDAKKLEAGVEFLKMQRSGAGNVLLGFDGCCRESREEFNKLPEAQEMFIVYSSSWNSWSNRQCFLSSSNCELGYVCLPVSRQRLVCKERPAGFNAAGEDTSHFTSMTGVGVTARTRLPRISVDDKAKVFGASGSLPSKWLKNIPAGCPMYWGETKSVAFWVQLLTELNAKCVVDVTPGSGSLAEAAMILGIQYCGFVTDPVHKGWLTNVIDRASVRQIVKSGTFLYQEDLAQSLKQMFGDVVEAEEEGDGQEDPDDCARASDEEDHEAPADS